MPTDPTTFLALAARCEAATGPDRALDAEIDCAIRFHDLRPAKPDDFDGKFGFHPGNLKCEHGFLQAERYTASLDAAASLVPAGWDWEAHSWGLVHVSPNIAHPLYCKRGQPTSKKAVCNSPALALLAAALRARAAGGGA